MTKMKAVDIQICTAALKVEHPELFHYTRPLSFEKILETQTLWSTYSGDLDDKKEIATLKPLLLQCVASVFNQEVKTRDTGTKNLFYSRRGGIPHATNAAHQPHQHTPRLTEKPFRIDTITNPGKLVDLINRSGPLECYRAIVTR